MPFFSVPTPIALVAKSLSVPTIVLAPTRNVYRLGNPITLSYRMRGVETIPVKPIGGFCTVGESDFRLSLQVTPLRGTLPTLPMHRGRGTGFVKGYAAQLSTPHTINANDDVCLSLPGDYRVTARLAVLRPAGTLREVVSNTVTVHVADSAALRAERLRRVRRAAQLLERTNAPTKTEAAVRALRYVSDPEALPVLLTAFNSDDIGVEAAAGASLAYWHDPKVLYDSAYHWLERHARKPESFNVLRWASVLQEARLRDKYPAATFGSPTDFATAEEAKATVKRLLLAGIPFLSRGEAGSRRIALLCYEWNRTATTDELRPILAAILDMTPKQLQGAVWYFARRRDPPTDDAMRPLRRETQAIAGNERMPAELRRVMEHYLAVDKP